VPASPPLTVVWDPRFRRYEFGPGHPFTERSRDLAVRLLAGSLEGEEARHLAWIREVEPSPPSSLALFHETEYVEAIRAAGEGRGKAWLDAGDTPSFPGCFDAARTIVGGMEAAVEVALDGRVAAFHPAGGLHHAAPARASGFCIFNDLAVGIARALRRGVRVAYIDLDVHHGDGVMYGFYDTGRVLAVDFH
jgi:acetoin utilization protein AcuC